MPRVGTSATRTFPLTPNSRFNVEMKTEFPSSAGRRYGTLVESLGAPPAPRRAPGLYHVAFLFPDRPSLGRAVGQVIESGVRITGAADHGVSHAVYLDDPDGNGIELYWDRPRAEWPRDAKGEL